MGSSYGGFYGGDPRNFSPDHECCTPDEIAAHKQACAAYERGDLELLSKLGGHECIYDKDGKLVMHIARNPFGIGITTTDDDEDEGVDGDGA